MKSYWIYTYGDYEIYHTNQVNTRRQQYGMDFPPFWRLYDVDRNVVFFSKQTAEKDGTLILHVNGKGYLKMDGQMYGSGKPVAVAAGEHEFSIHVMNLTGLPAAYLESNVVCTDGSWYTKDADQSRQPVGFDEAYTRPSDNPEVFPFSYESAAPITCEKVGGGLLFDFGKELFGKLHIDGVTASPLHVSYGESREEALDLTWAVVQEDVEGSESYVLRPRALRFLYLPDTVSAEVRVEVETLPMPRKAAFRCDNEDVNRIWDMCVYTLQLNRREVLTEAVKRDRWLWGGDAYQAFKFLKTLCADRELTRRSLIGLRGKEPFVEHINTITDYSLFWVIGLWEYYENYADADFLRRLWKRAISLMNFCADREDDLGFLVGKNGDWIFIDWAPMDKTGALCAEQMLYIAANRAMAKIAAIAGEDAGGYEAKAQALTEKVNRYFWDGERGAFIDSFASGKRSVTRHANILAVLYDIATEAQTESIVRHVLKNEDIPRITTPYFEGYELDVMGKIGNTDYLYHMLTTYWKGMLDLGATTVWEEYDPSLSGAAHYAMYGDPYQKSLCHAWGASPVYLLCRYFLGVRGTSAGDRTFEVSPQRGAFGFVEGAVPIGDGEVSVSLSENRLRVCATVGGGTLNFGGRTVPLEKDTPVEWTL